MAVMPWLKEKLQLGIDGLASPFVNCWHWFAHHINVWGAAWQHQKNQPAINLAKGDELEFLPAVLEVHETPASPAGRSTVWAIMTLFVLAVIWAVFGKIDIVAIANGKIIPSNHSKRIQPLEAGVVNAIHVEEGQKVKKGDVLIELDNTVTEADVGRLSHERMLVEMDAARLRALINNKKIIPSKNVSNEVSQIQYKILADQVEEYNARMAAAKLLVKQRRAALKGVEENIKYLSEAVPLLKERVDSIKKMLEKKFVSRMSYLEVQDDYLEKAQQLAAYKKQLIQSKAALDEAIKQNIASIAEINKINRIELANAEAKEKLLSQEIIKANSRTENQRLVSPIDGVVQQLAVHTIGGVVTPAQELMVIVPEENRYQIEAWVENKDIGFVNLDQKVEIKIEAFPFTKYGTIDGQVLTLSKDAIPLENVGYVYSAQISMAKSVINVGSKLVNLAPGMNVTVEVKTGKRRVIEFFLSPLLRGINETARER